MYNFVFKSRFMFSSAKKLLLEIELIKMEDTYIVIYIIFLLLYNIHFKQ